MKSEIAEQRSNVYGLLALVFGSEPKKELLKTLGNDGTLEALKEAGVDLTVTLNSGNEEQILEELAVEYTRLFIGPGKHIYLQESVWREGEGTLMGESTISVKKLIEGLGLKYRTEWSGLPDHIGAELELMQKLTKREWEAWEANDPDSALQCLEIEKKFMNDHINKWIPEFCEKTISESSMDFYRELSKLMRDFVNLEGSQIEELLSKEG